MGNFHGFDRRSYTDRAMNDQELSALAGYFELMAANGAVSVYQSAKAAGVLDVFAKGPATAAQVAACAGLAERSTALLLECLRSLKLLNRVDDSYAPTPALEFLLGSYQNLSQEYWMHLPEFLRSDAPFKRMDSAEISEAEYVAQARSLEWMLKAPAALAAEQLGIGDERRGCRIVDLGAGAAVWSVAMLARDPEAHAVAVDWPAVLALAARAAEEAGVSARFEARPGDLRKLELPSQAFDLALLGNVTHLLTPEQNVGLFARVRDWLAPAGALVVFDILSDDPRGSLASALYALGLALRTENGRVYRAAELGELVRKAGYSRWRVESLGAPPYTMGMLVAE